MTFNYSEFEDALAQLSFAQDITLHWFESIPSTNSKLWELIEGGATPGTVAIAQQQTAGRGQWGRQWQSEPGGLYLSVALTPNLLAKDSAHITLFTAWGIATALRQLHIPVHLKWPNDLILNGRKLGGIKTETRTQKERITHAVTGVGINWKNSTPDLGINLHSFSNSQFSSLEELAAVVLSGIFLGYEFYENFGIQSLLTAYLKVFTYQGLHITYNDNPGVILGITSEGNLRVHINSSGASSEICLPPGSINLGYNLDKTQK